jgi:outer membrane immunogenic protein
MPRRLTPPISGLLIAKLMRLRRPDRPSRSGPSFNRPWGYPSGTQRRISLSLIDNAAAEHLRLRQNSVVRGRAMLGRGEVLFLLFLSGISLPARAADLSVKAIADKSEPLTWNGAYIGLHIGGQNVRTDVSRIGTGPSFSSSTDNVLGGALAGYNWQTGVWVYGIEGDWSLIRNGPDFHPNLFTLRGRAGWAHENVLLYATAGVGTKNDRSSRGILPFGGGPVQIVQTVEPQSVGPVAGGGVEVRLPYRLSVRAEGLYYFENPRYDFVAGTFNGVFLPAASFDQRQQHFIYRASLIYNFN